MLKITSKIRVEDKFISKQLDDLNKKSSNVQNKLIIEELHTLFKVSLKNGKKARSIPYGKNGPEDLISIGKLLSKTQSKKDRVCEIQMSFITKLRELHQIRTILSNHIKTNYSKDLSNLRTIGDKEDFINLILFDIDDKIEAIESLKELSDKVLINLTNTYYTLREVKEIALAFVPKHLTSDYERRV